MCAKRNNSNESAEKALATQETFQKKALSLKKITDNMDKAVDVVVGLLTSNDPKRRFEAATFLIDHGLGKPRQQVEISTDDDTTERTAAHLYEVLKKARELADADEAPISGYRDAEGTYQITNGEYTSDAPTDDDNS